MLCLAWQNLIAPFHWARLGHDDCLPNLNFHMYNITNKPRKSEFYFHLFSLVS